VIHEQFEARCKSSAEREAYARNLLRLELIAKAEAGDVEGVKKMLLLSVEEAMKEGTHLSPRITAESRNDLGQSILSIASQYNHESLALFLLSYVQEYTSKHEYNNNELQVINKVFNSKPNSRDLKGWSCVCVSIFHSSFRVLRILLQYGGDPTIKSSYNKNAWDLAKDEIDAAGNVITSHSEVRAILKEYFTEGAGILRATEAHGEGIGSILDEKSFSTNINEREISNTNGSGSHGGGKMIRKKRIVKQEGAGNSHRNINQSKVMTQAVKK
jgi:ankyrin repeat protein